jgi:2'-5' RNA ligase
MRFFFALWPAPDVAERLADVARALASRFGGKPTRQESIHLTLAFLGDLSDDALPVLTQTAQTIAATAFTLSIDRLGYWPRKQLLWAGERLPNADLVKLVDDLETALNAAGFALAGRYPMFSPHVTLVRGFPAAGDALTPSAIDAISWPCSRFALIRSQRSDAGSLYETVADFPLNGSSAA